MCSTSSSSSISTVHPDIIQSLILNRLDGPTLAATSCASPQLLSLCSDDYLWKRICNSAWPSTSDQRIADAISTFPAAHRSFYSDSFPAPKISNARTSSNNNDNTTTSELISAVDIFYGDDLLYSKVLAADASHSPWLLGSPLTLDLLELDEVVPMPLKFDGEEGACGGIAADRLRLSWIVIDPAKKRAVNVASGKAVESRWHWMTEDLRLRFATVMSCGNGGDLVQCAVVVNCGGKDGGEMEVREVSMRVEDMEGRVLTAWDSLGILRGAMEGERWKCDGCTEKEMYDMFVREKIKFRERKERMERAVDMVFVATGVSIFFAFWILFLSR